MISIGQCTTLFLLSLLIFFSLAGNLLIIISAIVNKKLRSATHILILNLAISDLLISTFSLPLRTIRLASTASLMTPSSARSTLFCRLTTALSITLFASSNFNLFLLTLDRYIGIKFPLQYKVRPKSVKLAVCITISWVLALITGIFPLLVPYFLQQTKGDFACTFGSTLTKSYHSFVTVLILFAPFFIMVVLYISILRTVHQSWNFSTTDDDTEMKQEKPGCRRCSIAPEVFKGKEIKLTKVICAILAIHCVCLVPISVIDLLYTFHAVHPHKLVTKICLGLSYFHQVINPPIYATACKEYKLTFLKILSCFGKASSAKNSLRCSLTKAGVRRRSRRVSQVDE